MNYIYYLEDPISDRKGALIRFDKETGEMCVYDFKKKKWEENYEYLKIFYGAIEADPISPEEANKLIRENDL